MEIVNMRVAVRAALLAASLAGGSVYAADLPPAPPPAQAPAAYIPAPPPVYNWGGIYLGINGGWGWGNGKWTVLSPAFGSVSGQANDNGGVVGATFGANFQTGALVFGLEGDWDYSAINSGTSANFCQVSGQCQTGNNWLSTLRGRAGYAADRVLFYLTAGGAFANMQTTFNGVGTTHTQAGWTAGIGAEWAFADNWTAKVEYLYVNLGNGSTTCATATCLAFFGGSPNVSVGLTENLFRVGVNYKFNF